MSLVERRLAAAGCVAAEEEARELRAAAPDRETLEAWVRRRERGEPLAWITGSTVFCGRVVRLDAGVYVPRPQTEGLVRRALAVLPAGGRAVDLCAGSGAVAACLGPGAIGVDVDAVAVACARRNGVPAVRADVAAVPLAARAFDVVTAVAPYVPTAAVRLLPADVQRYEPRLALDGGEDGLGVVRVVVSAARRLLRPGGWLLVEVGGDQDEALDLPGFDEVSPWFDEGGYLRGLAARSAG